METQEDNDDEEIPDIEWETLNKNINKLTTLLNEFGIDYQRKVWESFDGVDIFFGSVVGVFHAKGLIEFKSKSEIE